MDITEWIPAFPVAAEDDSELMRYFLSIPHINDIVDRRKWMVLGRKGTGKTALYQWMQSDQYQTEQRVTVPLNFRDYPWPIHRLYKESMEGEISAYSRSWEYVILVKAIAKLIERLNEERKSLGRDLRSAQKVIETVYGRPNPTLLEVVKAKLYRLDKLSLPQLSTGDVTIGAGELSFEEVAEDRKLLSKLRSNAFTLLDYFRQVLRSASTNKEIVVTMDQLDENWLSDQLEEYSKILINLVTTARSINNDQSVNASLRVVVFLRTDIYESLRFNDKNKVFQSSAVEIRWTPEALNEFMAQRVFSLKPENVQLDRERGAEAIFRSEQLRHGATPFRHILRRTFYRPRDVVVFYNKIRERHDPGSDSSMYERKDIYDAERDYSVSLYNELIDEWANQRPQIESYLAALQDIGTQTFAYADFRDALGRVVGDDSRSTVTAALDFLFQNSIVGQKISLNWEYCCSNPYMQIDYAKQFHVNNGLKTRLTLTEARTTRR